MEPSYGRVPTTGATVQSPAGADYAIPPSAPSGDVRLASYGVTDVWPTDRSQAGLHAIHLRVVLTNDGATTWTFDAREQRLGLGGGAVIPPAFVSADGGSPPPLMTVPPAARRVADIFFLLPPELQRTEQLPAFDVLWEVEASSEVVKERTPLALLVVDPGADVGRAADHGPDYFWGEPYWMNPSSPWSAGGALGDEPFIRLDPDRRAYRFSSR